MSIIQGQGMEAPTAAYLKAMKPPQRKTGSLSAHETTTLVHCHDVQYKVIYSCITSYLSPWLLRSPAMHFPKISRELLMFPASFRRSPKVLVLLHRSEPARSHRESLKRKKGDLFYTIHKNPMMRFKNK